MEDRLKQIRMNALAADYVYSRELGKIKFFTVASNALTILVPILFLSVLLVAKGTKYEKIINDVSTLLSGVLLTIVVLGLIFGLEQKKESYLIGRRGNIYVASEALKLLASRNWDQNMNWFLDYVNEMDSRDGENIGAISERTKKKANRSALERLFPGKNNTVCAICGASPFQFKRMSILDRKGKSCSYCGNFSKVEK